MSERFSRQEAFFGVVGQEKIVATRVAVVGIGGLGTHVVQQLAHLGVRKFALIDDEELDATNLNRYVGSRFDDPIPGTRKVSLGRRIIESVCDDSSIEMIDDSIVSETAFNAVKRADSVFGCLDNDGARLVLNELTSAYDVPYFDLATDILVEGEPQYGGRVVVSVDRPGCVVCLGQLDIREAALDLSDPHRRCERERLYGISAEALSGTGPSVVSINGLIVSLAVTEFMVHVTGIRKANRVLTYRGSSGVVTKSLDEPTECFSCSQLGRKEKADVERYIRDGVLPSRHKVAH